MKLKLIPTDEESNILLYFKKGKLQASNQYITNDLFKDFIKKQIIVIIDENKEFKPGDLILGGPGDEAYDTLWEWDGSSHLSDEDKKVVASSSEKLTPNHLISKSDLQTICEFYNEHGVLPELTLEKESIEIPCPDGIEDCEVFHAEEKIKTIDNCVVISWKKIENTPNLLKVDNTPNFTYANRLKMQQWSKNDKLKAIEFLNSILNNPDTKVKPEVLHRKSDNCPFTLQKNGLYQATDEHGTETLDEKDSVEYFLSDAKTLEEKAEQFIQMNLSSKPIQIDDIQFKGTKVKELMVNFFKYLNTK